MYKIELLFIVFVLLQQVHGDKDWIDGKASKDNKSFLRSGQKKFVSELDGEKKRLSNKKKSDNHFSSKPDLQEGERICLAIKQESLPDFFMKFGLVTKQIQDVAQFKRQMKNSNSGWERKKLYRLESEEKYYFKSKIGGKVNPFKHGYLLNKQSRNDLSYMPPCYGFNYLTAIDALLDDNGSMGPDLDIIGDLMSDMEDMKLTSELLNIYRNCDTSNSDKNECPPIDTSILKDKKRKNIGCPNNCVTNNECATKEICCPNICGRRNCFNPSLASKYRSEEEKLAVSKCKEADRFLQCVYQGVKQLQRCLN